MVLIYQVLTRQCLKKVFLTSNDFVPNDSSLLKHQILQSTLSPEFLGLMWRSEQHMFRTLKGFLAGLFTVSLVIDRGGGDHSVLGITLALV